LERILLIDDEPSIRMLGKRVLEGAGFEVTVAEDGPTGVKHFQSNPHDLIIIDLTLPGEQPLSALEEIRKTGSNVPVLVISGHDIHDETFTRARENELVTDVLAKPFELTDLIKAVKTCLQA